MAKKKKSMVKSITKSLKSLGGGKKSGKMKKMQSLFVVGGGRKSKKGRYY